MRSDLDNCNRCIDTAHRIYGEAMAWQAKGNDRLASERLESFLWWCDLACWWYGEALDSMYNPI
jgi:hypothetical protein